VKRALAIIAVVLTAFAAAVSIGSRRQRAAHTELVEQLRSRGGGADETGGGGNGADLPPPVERYLRWAIQTDAPVQEVRMRQTGTLRTDVDSDRWMSFEAEHIAVPPATGFVWNAKVAVAPLLHVRVTDALVAGRGSGRVTLLSSVPVGGQAGTPEMNAGSLHRYLAEAVWYPVALWPSPQLRWTAIDETRSLATLTSHDVTVSLEFRFGETGEVTGIYTPARWGTFDDGYRQVPWEGHFRDYRDQHGMRVPAEGDVGWYVGGRWKAVWKGRITDFEVRRADASR
jgi:hypothetical protein